MRFHVSSNVTGEDIAHAASVAGATVVSVTEHRSKSHAKAYEIKLSGNSSRNAMGQDYKAATFDQWGVFIESLYRIDGNESMLVAGAYFDYHHFVWTHADRYAQLLSDTVDAHKQHKWEWQGHSATGSYSVQSCKCGAILRRVTVRQGESTADAWHRITDED